MAEMQVKRYNSSKEFQHDAGKMAKAGWRIIAQTQEKRRPGCARIGCLGIFAAIFPPKPVFVVTYQKP